MSVLLEALARSNERKEAIWGGKTATLGDDGLLLMMSGCDLDPADLAGYLDITVASFAIEMAAGIGHKAVMYGLLAEGLLMGRMIEAVNRDRKDWVNVHVESEPSICETAKQLASLCLLRAQRFARAATSGDEE